MEPSAIFRRTPDREVRVRRLPEKQVRDRGALDAILDAALVAHVAVTDGGRQLVVPVAVARDHDEVLIHGSTASRAFRLLAAGQNTCLTVTLLDAMVVAHSQFESSMNYRSAMVFGCFEVLGGAAKEHGVAVLMARLLPGLGGARPPSATELKATTVLALPLDTWSVKVSAGFADESDVDAARPGWAGIVPLEHRWGTPRTAPGVPSDTPVPTAISRWPQGRA
jgi:uncharacterized protein